MNTPEQIKHKIIESLYELIENIKNETTCKDYSMEWRVNRFEQVLPNYWEREVEFIVRRTETQEIKR